MTEINIGDSIPLSVQVWDKNADLDVKAKLTDNFGILLEIVPLVSYGEGLYMSQIVKMPDVKFVVAQYLIEPDDYETTSETFFSIPKPSEPQKFIVGEVQSRIKSNEYTIGVVTT